MHLGGSLLWPNSSIFYIMLRFDFQMFRVFKNVKKYLCNFWVNVACNSINYTHLPHSLIIFNSAIFNFEH